MRDILLFEAKPRGDHQIDPDVDIPVTALSDDWRLHDEIHHRLSKAILCFLELRPHACRRWLRVIDWDLKATGTRTTVYCGLAV